MKKTLIFALFLAVVVTANAQFEGIQKGDNEITFNGSATTLTFGESSTVNGTAFLSYGYYISDRTIIGLAPGMTVFGGSDIETETSYSMQLFCNINLANNQPVIPYLRFVFYKFDLETEDTEYIQFGGGIKYFFAERAAWDTLITYGTAISSEGSTVLMLTGLTYIF